MQGVNRELNEQQLRVVTHPGGPMLVIAGAGSGKTRTLTYRVAHLLRQGLDPRRMVLLTFTNKAAREMLQRVAELVGPEAQRIWGGTFHHLGNLILRRHAPLLGYGRGYTILDREDQRSLLRSCLKELALAERRFPSPQVLAELEGLRANLGRSLEELLEERWPHLSEFAPRIARVLERYRRRKRELNLMDYDDLLVRWWELFQEHPEVRCRWAKRFQHVLVDEYQDTTPLQAQLVDILAEVHGNLMVVGDDCQSIYSFRGASLEHLLSFPRRHPGTTVYYLETNYRSTPQILNLANRVIAHNPEQFSKVLRPVRPRGPVPLACSLADEAAQAAFVADRVEEHRRRGVPLSEMAVLYRAHYQSLELQLELTRRRIPYLVRSGMRFFERAHVKDVMAMLRLAVNPRDEAAWRRSLSLWPGIGSATLERVLAFLRGVGDPWERLEDVEMVMPGRALLGWRAFRRVLEGVRRAPAPAQAILSALREGYGELLSLRYPDHAERLADLRQLAEHARGFRSAEELLAELTLLGAEDAQGPLEPPEQRLVLSSIHQSKGLEWSVVFVIWLTEGRFPLPCEEEELREERRLFYVAVTRAKDELYLCCPRRGRMRGSRLMLPPSRFLQEADGSCRWR